MKGEEERFLTFLGETGLFKPYFTILIVSSRQFYAYTALFLHNSDSFAQRSHL
jgi:hypothetical protein